MNGVDVFCGAGGMSMGAIMAGINIEVAVENNKNAIETYIANHPNTRVVQDDIQNVSLQGTPSPFVFFGGPPCQGFSVSNTKTRNTANTNNSLFYEYIRLVRELNPKWFVFENVEGIKSFNNGAVVDELEREFRQLGYDVSFDVLFACDYGVPQSRNRFFMVGNRLGVNFSFPERMVGKISVQDAISDLPTLQNGEMCETAPYKSGEPSAYAQLMRNGSTASQQNYVSRNQDYVIERYKHIGQGENWKSIPAHLMENYKDSSKCHSGIYKRLHAQKPSVVIANYRKNMLIHPFEHRGLSVREAARIQSFPDSFTFKGSLMHIQQQIGNAVPPLLAKAIFQQIINLTPEHERN